MTEWLRAFVSEPMSFLQQAFFRMVAILIGLCCHEWGHAYVAWRCGDDTAKKAGRMTLNPLAHLDPFGTLLMLFAGFGYAKPVPVNPNRFRGNRLRADFSGLAPDRKADWADPTWGLPGNRIEKIDDPSRGSTLTVHYYDSEDGVCRTAFTSVSGQQHECRHHSCENAWKFISRFRRE